MSSCRKSIVLSIPRLCRIQPGDLLERDNVGEIVLRSTELLAVDDRRFGGPISRFVLVDGFDTVGGGLVSMAGYPDERQALLARFSNLSVTEHEVARENRAIRNRHYGGVLLANRTFGRR